MTGLYGPHRGVQGASVGRTTNGNAAGPTQKENVMIVQMTEEVMDALEVLTNSPPGNQVKAAHILLRCLSTNEDIGVVGRGFIRESFHGVAVVLDWMAVGKRGTP